MWYLGWWILFKECLQCDPNCKTCSDSAKKCLSCEIGYYLSSSNSCEQCPQFCNECTNENICTSCINNNYFLYNNKCYQCNINCKTTNDNCRCDTCDDGYYLKN